ncbi:MAG: VTC domain-containing protein [Myxococcales bacterium]|nr:VTC domain-containing protein [Myxococcales bacterium]
MTLRGASPNLAQLSMVQLAARTLDVACDALLADRSLQRRREWKLPVHVRALPEVLRALSSSHAVVLSGQTALARYRTTYADTPDLRCFHDHRRGRPRRAKVRVRHYLDRRLARLEIKMRQPRGHTDKQVAWRSFGHRDLDRCDRAFAQQHLDWCTADLQPVLEVRFRRITLVGRVQQERITLDCDLSWSGPTGRVARPHLGVIEVKNATRAGAEPTLRALSRLGIRAFSASKYALGVAQLHPGVRCHRLRPALRHVIAVANGGTP